MQIGFRILAVLSLIMFGGFAFAEEEPVGKGRIDFSQYSTVEEAQRDMLALYPLGSDAKILFSNFAHYPSEKLAGKQGDKTIFHFRTKASQQFAVTLAEMEWIVEVEESQGHIKSLEVNNYLTGH